MKRKRLGKITPMNPEQILGSLSIDLVRDGMSRGMTLSSWLERICPRETDDKSNLDAFSRVVREAEIFVRSDPSVGIYADTWEDAFDPVNSGMTDREIRARRVLGMEWMQRMWRKASFASQKERGEYLRGGGTAGQRDSNVLTSNDYTVGSWERPYSDAAQYRLQQIQPAIPLDTLIAVTTPVDNNTYRAVYIEDVDPKAKRMVRVGETAEVPRVIFKSAERTVNLYKYGRVIESSYEVLRRQRLDRVAVEIALMSVQVENDKVSSVIDVIVNGDGNAGTAAVPINLTTLDSGATANNPRLQSWIAFKMLFKNPYHLRVLLGEQDPITKAMLINTGSANVPLAVISQWLGLGGFTVLNNTLGDAVRYGVLDTDANLTNKWIGLDDRFEIERVYEIGANITEVERYTTRQTETLTMTEVEGYAVLDKRGAHVVVLNA